MKGVTFFRVKFNPVAKCQEETCDWPRRRGAGPDARREAQHHVRDTGHEVVVDVLDRTSYSPDGTP